MKNKLFFLFLLLFTSCTIKNEVSQPEINSFAQLKKLFKTPPVNYRSVPFWVWNDDITEKQRAKEQEEIELALYQCGEEAEFERQAEIEQRNLLQKIRAKQNIKEEL